MEMTSGLQRQDTHLWGLECKAECPVARVEGLEFIHTLTNSLTTYGAFIICQTVDEALEIYS